KGEKQKANAEGQKRGRWAQPLSSFGLHRFHFVFPGYAVENSNSGIGTESIDAASNRIIHQLCGFPHHGDGAITLAAFAQMITIGVSMRNARGEARRTKRRQKGVGNEEWGMGMRKRNLPPLPTPHSPFPLCFILFTQIGRVIEGNRYVFSSPVADHRLFSDHRNLDSTIAVFTNGVEAVSAETARAAKAPSHAIAPRRRPGPGDQRATGNQASRAPIPR